MASDFVESELNLPKGGNFDLLHIFKLVIHPYNWTLGITRHVSITIILFRSDIVFGSAFAE